MAQPGRTDRFIHGCSVSPGKVACYTIPEHWLIHGRPGRRDRDTPKVITPEERARRNTGRVISRYWQAVGWLWLRTRAEVIDLGNGRRLRHRQGFLTLTLPGVATADHKAVKAKILDPFFTYCRNVLGLRDYVWTAELQDRGEIHFHAIVNQFLPKAKVRAAWLRHCDASGIIARSGEGSRPATEIEECRDWNGSRVYAGKYLSKALRSGDIVGRVWSGSHSVTGIGSLSTNECDQAFDVPGALLEIKRAGAQWRQHDHGISTARYDVAHITRRRSPILHRLFKDHLNRVDNPTADHANAHTPTYRNAPGTDPAPAATAQTSDQRSTCGAPVDRAFSQGPGRARYHGAPTGTRMAGKGSLRVAVKAPPLPDLWDFLRTGGLGGVHPSSVPLTDHS